MRRRWQVFAELEGKAGHRWWLWVMVTADTCAYILDPSRSAAVPQNHLEGKTSGIINADRYSAYKALDKIKIAFCWNHVRRDFLRVRDGYRPLRRWGQGWVVRIDELFKLNARRLEFSSMPDAFAAEPLVLRETMTAMVLVRDQELADASLHPAARKALTSLRYQTCMACGTRGLGRDFPTEGGVAPRITQSQRERSRRCFMFARVNL